MAGHGLRPYRLTPLNRGCVETVVVNVSKDDAPEDLTAKKCYFTAKEKPWDDVTDDSSAIFKKLGVVEESEPGRIVFALSKTDTYLDPRKEYYCDVVITDENDENPERLFIGSFTVIGGANNEQAGGNQ